MQIIDIQLIISNANKNIKNKSKFLWNSSPFCNLLVKERHKKRQTQNML
ncbi:MAG: hypothetical protein ACI9VN_003008 [Patescibacteria group bacterium]|jgi:hypothetical protein